MLAGEKKIRNLKLHQSYNYKKYQSLTNLVQRVAAVLKYLPVLMLGQRWLQEVGELGKSVSKGVSYFC